MNDPEPALPPEIGDLAGAILESSRSSTDRRNIMRLIKATTSLVRGPGSSLDVKIASAALQEMTKAYEVFAPWRDVPKVTIFGSARTRHDDPIYQVTARAAAELAERGYMVVTGAGPGIMEAGMVGAGRERSIGVSIRLPFETGANSVIAGDEKYVSMRYFFTRKLMLVKESHAFLCMPGGFGTLDETFELLTLGQTAKSVPVPVVFLEIEGRPFWSPLMATLEPLLLGQGLISPEDTSLYTVTDDVDLAVAEFTGFYANYHSIRFVADTMIVRMKRAVPDDEFENFARRHAHLTDGTPITRTDPSDPEMRDEDVPNLPRIAVRYAAKGFASLRPLIDDLNRW
ncbi:MAG: TIGR00730 family Rossman fold protein [Ilumatobacteraceae bacterium]